LTLDRVEVTLVRICGRGLPTNQIRWKSEKLFVDVRTYGRMYGRTHLSSNLLGHRRGDDLIKQDRHSTHYPVRSRGKAAVWVWGRSL